MGHARAIRTARERSDGNPVADMNGAVITKNTVSPRILAADANQDTGQQNGAQHDCPVMERGSSSRKATFLASHVSRKL